MPAATKKRITTIVEDYINLFPDEYAAFQLSIRAKRDAQLNALSSTGKDSSTIEQLVHEIPETLYMIFKSQLTENELKEYHSRAGTLWFGRTFRVFAVAQKI